MRRMLSTWGMLGLASLLAGCAVAPTRYYSLATLVAEQPAGGQAAGTERGDVRLSVTRMPPETERPQLVVRDPARDPAVQILNESLWAAPLSDQIQAVLTAEVRQGVAALGSPQPAVPDDRTSRRIDVQIDRFDMVWGQFVALDAHWADRQPGAGHIRQCQASIRVPATGDVAALVDAQRHALSRLGALMAQPAPAAGAGLNDDSILSEYGCT